MNSDQKFTGRIWLALTPYHPSAYLLAAQLLLLILYSIFDGLHSQRALISALGVIVLLPAVWIVSRSSWINWIAWALAIPAFLIALASSQFINSTLVALASLFEAALYFYTAGSLIAYMMGDYKVTVDELFAAGATFTLLAWGFAHSYLVCLSLSPESIISTLKPGGQLTFIEMLSLSFTNLSATGLSDMLPVSTLARVLVMLEQFVGVAYIAMVVSRLIGLTTQKQSPRP